MLTINNVVGAFNYLFIDVKTQARPKKRRPKGLERLYLGPIRREGLLAIVEGWRSYSKEEILTRAAVFLNVADRIKCEVCGCVYDGTNYFMVEYTGLLERLRHAYCGKCMPEIKKLVNAIYKEMV
jgi:hypothetical protein